MMIILSFSILPFFYNYQIGFKRGQLQAYLGIGLHSLYYNKALVSPPLFSISDTLTFSKLQQTYDQSEDYIHIASQYIRAIMYLALLQLHDKHYSFLAFSQLLNPLLFQSQSLARKTINIDCQSFETLCVNHMILQGHIGH